MCSVWVHGAGVSLPSPNFQSSRLKNWIVVGVVFTSPDRARRTFCFVLRGSGQQTKSSCTQTTQQRITRSLFAAYTLNLVRINGGGPRRPPERSYASKSACFGLSFAIMLEVLRGNHNTRHLRRSPHLTAWPAKSLSRGRSAVPFSTVGLPRPAGGNFVARRSRSPCLPRRPQLRRSCS